MKALSFAAVALALATTLAVTRGPESGRAVPQHRWPMFQYNAEHNPVFARPDWDVSWRTSIGKKSNGGISIVGSTLYIDSFDHKVYAIDARTGAIRWQTKLPDVLMNTPIVDHGIVIVGTGTAHMLHDSSTYWVAGRKAGDEIAGLDQKTGRVLWTFHTVGEDMPTGALVRTKDGEQFVFTGGDDHIYGINARNGKLIWKQKAYGIDGMAPVTVVRGLVLGIDTLGDSGYFQRIGEGKNPDIAWGRTWAIDPSRGGRYVWKIPYGVADASIAVGGELAFIQGFALVNPTGKLAADLARRIGFGAFANSVADFSTLVTAVDLHTGKRVWTYHSSPGPNLTVGSAAFSSEGLYHRGVAYEPLAFARQLVAFRARTGRVLWKLNTKYPVKTGAVIARGLLYFGDSGGFFYVVDAHNGRILHVLHFDGPPNHSGFAKSPAVIVGKTLFVSDSHYVMALRLEDLNRGIARF